MVALRCAHSSLNGAKGVFDICDSELFPIFNIKNIIPETKSVNNALHRIKDEARKEKSNTLIQFIPTNAAFDIVDGLLLYKGSDDSIKIIGYQVKGGRGRVGDQVKIPEWMEKVVVIKGEAYKKIVSKGKFKFLRESEVLDFLGCSMETLHPNKLPMKQSKKD